MPTKSHLFGRSVGRIEDRALVVGDGCYLDDLHPENCLAAAFVRSTHAHALFSTVHLTAALAMPDVVAAFTAAELKKLLASNFLSTGLPSPSFLLHADRPVLADGEVAYVGEPIAVVIATSRSLAEDAVEAVAIDFKALPPVVDCREALEPGSAHRSFATASQSHCGFRLRVW